MMRSAVRAAIDCQVRAGDVRCLRIGDERHHRGDIFSVTIAVECGGGLPSIRIEVIVVVSQRVGKPLKTAMIALIALSYTGLKAAVLMRRERSRWIAIGMLNAELACHGCIEGLVGSAISGLQNNAAFCRSAATV